MTETNRSIKGRAAARSRYHDAIASFDTDFMPLFVRDSMDAWEFDSAMEALAPAEEAMAHAATTDQDRGGSRLAETGLRLTQASSLAQVQDVRDQLMTRDPVGSGGRGPASLKRLARSCALIC